MAEMETRGCRSGGKGVGSVQVYKSNGCADLYYDEDVFRQKVIELRAYGANVTEHPRREGAPSHVRWLQASWLCLAMAAVLAFVRFPGSDCLQFSAACGAALGLLIAPDEMARNLRRGWEESLLDESGED